MRESEQCPFVVLEVPSDMRVEGKPRFLFANKVPKSSNILFSGDKILHGIHYKEMQEAGLVRSSQGRPPFKRFPPFSRGFGRFKTASKFGGPPAYYGSRPRFMNTGPYQKYRYNWNMRRPYGYRGFTPRKFAPAGRSRYYGKSDDEGDRTRHYSGSSYGDERGPPPRGSPVYDDEDDDKHSDASDDSLDYHSSGKDDYSSTKKSSKSKHKHLKRKSRYKEDSDSRHYDHESRSSSRSGYKSVDKSPSRYNDASPKRYSSESPPKKSVSKHHGKFKSNKSFEYSPPPEHFDKPYMASYKQSGKRPYSSKAVSPSPMRDYRDYSPDKGKAPTKPYAKKYSPEPSYKDYLPPKKHYSPGSKSSDEEHYGPRPRHYSPRARHYYKDYSPEGHYSRPSYSKQHHPGTYKDRFLPSTSHYKTYDKKGGRYSPSYERDSYSSFGGPSKGKYYDRKTPPHAKYSHPYPPPYLKRRTYSPPPEDHFNRKYRDDERMWVQKMLSKVGNLKPFVNPSKTQQVVFLDVQSNPSFFHEMQDRLLPKGTFVCLFHGVVRGTILPPNCPAIEALQRAECFFTHPDCNTPRGLAVEALTPVALLLHNKLPPSIPFFIVSKIPFHHAVHFIKQSREVQFIPMDSNAVSRLINSIP